MNAVAGKAFWFGIFNATLLSIPMWLLLYLSLRIIFF